MLRSLPAAYSDFLQLLPTPSPRRGLIKFLTPNTEPSLASWNSSAGWHDDWPGVKTRLVVFAYDWMGRQIAFDHKENMNISQLDPGTGHINSVPSGFLEFVETLLVDSVDDVLSEVYYEHWISQGNRPIAFNECVGYKIPLFLGGEDTYANLELSDLSVYISLMGQLYTAAAALPTTRP